MAISDEHNNVDEIDNLELAHWVSEENSMRGQALKYGKRPDKRYQGFDDLYSAILEHGPLVVTTNRADLTLFTPCGEFDGHIIAIRQSGRNVRRILVRSDRFEDMFGSVENCISHLLSNNVPECAVELKHLHAVAKAYGLSGSEVDPSRSYGRLEVDIVAAIQLLDLLENCFDDDEDTNAIFEIGFSVGRLFSSAQNLATLEPDAAKAQKYEESYVERGKKGKSKDRKRERIDHLFEHLVALVAANSALSRLKPIEVAKLALEDASNEKPMLWSQGGGQLEQYLTVFASDPKYQAYYYKIFRETG